MESPHVRISGQIIVGTVSVRVDSPDRNRAAVISCTDDAVVTWINSLEFDPRIGTPRVDRRALRLAFVRVEHETVRNANVDCSDIVPAPAVNTGGRQQNVVENFVLETEGELIGERSLELVINLRACPWIPGRTHGGLLTELKDAVTVRVVPVPVLGTDIVDVRDTTVADTKSFGVAREIGFQRPRTVTGDVPDHADTRREVVELEGNRLLLEGAAAEHFRHAKTSGLTAPRGIQPFLCWVPVIRLIEANACRNRPAVGDRDGVLQEEAHSATLHAIGTVWMPAFT